MDAVQNQKAEGALREFTREELLEVARSAPEQLVDLVLVFQEQVRELRREMQEVKECLAKNSSNSNKPPGSDGLGKPSIPKSLRSQTGRKAGGQPGHSGHTLQRVQNPDHTVTHGMTFCTCGHCSGVSLARQPVLGYEKRQVFDLPPLSLEVTEHRSEIKRCPYSGHEVRAPFPKQVTAPAQYGVHFRGLLVYLNQQQLLPFERIGQLCEDLFGQPLSLATLLNANQDAYAALEGFESQVAAQLCVAPVVHVDESGLRVEGCLQWVHSAGTAQLTHYFVHPKRGTEAMDAAGILPHVTGWMMHDFWKSYFSYDSPHALCNQHLLRELKFLFEEQHQAWAGRLSDLLNEFHVISKEDPPPGEKLLEDCFARYHAVLEEGRILNPHRGKDAGRAKQSKGCNLLNRLENYDQCILAFLSDPQVPFTNNQAEQDIRMVKVKQKISGCFRTLQGARIFARIRGFFSTARKQKRRLMSSLIDALRGEPFVPVPAN